MSRMNLGRNLPLVSAATLCQLLMGTDMRKEGALMLLWKEMIRCPFGEKGFKFICAEVSLGWWPDRKPLGSDVGPIPVVPYLYAAVNICFKTAV